MSKIQIAYILFLSGLSIILVAFLVVWFFILKPIDRQVVGPSADSIDIDGEERHYRLFNASQEEERPLVVLLHGFKDRAEWVGIYSGFNILAERESFALLLPQGFGLSWNAEVCCGPAFQRGVNDTKFIAELTKNIVSKYNINTDKVYIVGFSNGGLMAQRVLNEEPSRFAAAAVLMSGVGSELAKLDISNAQAPIMLIQGDSDKYITLKKEEESAEVFNLTSVEETVSAWTKHYDANLTQSRETDKYLEKIYKNDREVKVQQRLYKEQGHTWPDRRLWNFELRVPESTVDIWNFLNNYSK